ncbi:TerC family protein [Streptomyces sp. HMX87]|uniref:TerC family protein n=1 Tax=Streptomyces sp. HMX87 TaxID=3390849 RepID=UPI003A887A5C
MWCAGAEAGKGRARASPEHLLAVSPARARARARAGAGGRGRREPYIVFAANAFALLGLRALFFLVKGLLDRLVYLSAGLALIPAFIGVKLILHWAHVDVSEAVPETPLSLAVIAAVLVVVTVASLFKTRRDPTAKAHPGSLRAHPPSPRSPTAEAESAEPRTGLPGRGTTRRIRRRRGGDGDVGSASRGVVGS